MMLAPLLSTVFFFSIPNGEAARQGPVVVELFTSQGCPVCPAANIALGEMGEGEDVIAIAYGVGHWDAFGWSDRYARPEFNARQSAYVERGEARRVYTPQFVINGGPERHRFTRDDIPARVAGADRLTALAQIRREGETLVISMNGPEREAPAQVWLVAYETDPVAHTVKSGRNAGVEMHHHNMAVSLDRLDDWAGGAYRVEAPVPGEGLGSVVLVQAEEGGRLLSAARLARED